VPAGKKGFCHRFVSQYRGIRTSKKEGATVTDAGKGKNFKGADRVQERGIQAKKEPWVKQSKDSARGGAFRDKKRRGQIGANEGKSIERGDEVRALGQGQR